MKVAFAENRRKVHLTDGAGNALCGFKARLPVGTVDASKLICLNCRKTYRRLEYSPREKLIQLLETNGLHLHFHEFKRSPRWMQARNRTRLCGDSERCFLLRLRNVESTNAKEATGT